MNEDIIPITYVGGTGGNFLCHFIVSAKRNDKTLITLSNFGNAHAGLKDIEGPPTGLRDPDIDKINLLIERSKDIDTPKPYYTIAHISSVDLLNKHFKRYIRIVYDIDDAYDLVQVKNGKWSSDAGYPYTNSLKLHAMYTLWHHAFKIDVTENNNVLFISWKELLKGNIDDLIDKISTFTQIDKSSFSVESLIHWRDKTQDCITHFSNIKL